MLQWVDRISVEETQRHENVTLTKMGTRYS